MTSEEIDVIKLYAQGNHKKWNAWLTDCLEFHKLDNLVSTRRGLQLGMAAAQRKGLVTQDLADTFARWIGSIDRTIRKIIKQRDRLNNDKVGAQSNAKTLQEKRQRDAELEKWLRKQSY